mmetsp:Transcript_46437/g.123190  ORF Transcript_46437/g.123190 Transcript_46437/m.123190 type:complete len:209 (+) Transcript_46437:1089-1715(+)
MTPRSPHWASYPCGRAWMKSWALARRAACSTRAWVQILEPYMMLSSIDMAKRTGSCCTRPTCNHKRVSPHEDHKDVFDQTDLVTEPLRVVLQNVHAVDVDRATLAVVEALDEIDESGLATTGSADKGQSLASRQVDGETVHNLDLGAGRIMEVNILELDVSFNSVGGDVATIIVHSGDTVEQLENTARSSDSLHELREDADQRAEREH